MRKKIISVLLSTAMTVTLLAGCGSSASKTSGTAVPSAASGDKEKVSLTVWGAEEDQSLLQEMTDSFKKQYADKADFDIQIGVQSESTAKDTVLTDVTAAADVYAFADDQINDLVKAGALQEITLDTDSIKSENIASSVDAATVDGKLYAYPMTADNGYFMFYDSEYFTDDDIKTMDGMLAAAKKAGKKVTMQLDSGWYLASFFMGAGLDLSLADDGVTNVCDWNSTDKKPTGADVADAILDIAKNDSFVSLTDEEFVSGIKDGSVIAGVNGVWNATAAQDAWGDNYKACKLPTYTVNGEQVQMGSFAGFKLLGVNPNSKNAGYAMLLAEWITNEQNQTLRFKERAQGPSNINAAASSDVQNSSAIAALGAQADFAKAQSVGGNFWDPATAFGTIMAQGNPDGTDVQTLLDTLVDGITAPVQ